MERGFIWAIILASSILITGCMGCKSVGTNVDYTKEGQQFEQHDTYTPWWK